MAMALVKSGWLWRQSSILRRWKRNWFVLYLDGSLVYYHDETQRDMDGRIHIKYSCRDVRTGRECRDVQPPEGKSRECLLTIVLRDGSKTTLCAESEDDAIARIPTASPGTRWPWGCWRGPPLVQPWAPSCGCHAGFSGPFGSPARGNMPPAWHPPKIILLGQREATPSHPPTAFASDNPHKPKNLSQDPSLPQGSCWGWEDVAPQPGTIHHPEAPAAEIPGGFFGMSLEGCCSQQPFWGGSQVLLTKLLF
uniref:Pleckstrin homology domain containing B1 n=1 Tax=Gallus gallus TaxID=9031 RepID=A0A8V0XHS5_CHICK